MQLNPDHDSAGKPQHADISWTRLAHSSWGGPIKRATECAGRALDSLIYIITCIYIYNYVYKYII